MVRRRALAVVALVAAAAALSASPAPASHTTTVAAKLDLAPAAACPAREKTRVSKCSGRRTARVTWSVSCASAPDASANVVLWASGAGGRPARRLGSSEEGGASGVTPFGVGPGTRVFATVTGSCEDSDLDAPTPAPHTATGQSGPTPAVLVAPRLKKVTAVVNRFCGRRVPASWLQTRLQARQAAGLEYDLGIDDISLLGAPRRSRAGRRKITVYARGAGLKVRKRSQTAVRTGLGRRPIRAGVTLAPRKAGKLRVWAKVAGIKTNALTVQVMKRGNCFKYSIGT